MKKLKKKFDNLTKKVKVMLVIFTLLTFTIITATYAWYISVREVFISSFNLRIESNLNLLLSLDGKNWDNVVFIDESNYNDLDNVYEGHTNIWPKPGLVPVSTSGEVDVDTSKLVIYQKLGMNTTAGGFRLLANKVNNGTKEREDYIAFDLFIKNFSSKKYIEEIDDLIEEAVYLGFNSKIKTAATGVATAGIENSVRVAFAQIGRVNGNTNNQEKITSITCNNSLLVLILI